MTRICWLIGHAWSVLGEVEKTTLRDSSGANTGRVWYWTSQCSRCGSIRPRTRTLRPRSTW